METTNRGNAPLSLRTTLLIDAAFEFVGGFVLVFAAGSMGDWLGFGSTASVAAGIVFIAAGIAILQLARQPHPDRALVQPLAVANVAGGIAGWVLLIVGWSWFQPEGRWALGMASDAVIIIGLLQLRALKRPSATASPAT